MIHVSNAKTPNEAKKKDEVLEMLMRNVNDLDKTRDPEEDATCCCDSSEVALVKKMGSCSWTT